MTHFELELRKHRRYEATFLPTVTTGSAYSAGQNVGGLLSLGTAKATAGTAGSGGGATNQDAPFEQADFSAILQSALLTDLDGQSKAINCWLFNAQPSTPTDKTTWAPTVADFKSLIGLIQFAAANYVSVNGGARSACSVPNCGLVIKPTTEQIWAVLQTGTSGTPTFTNGIQLKLQFSHGL